MNILISSAGTRNKVVQYFKKEMAGKVVAVDCSNLGPAIYDANGKIVYDAIVPQMLSGLPDILIALVVILVLSASMSTLSSLVLTSSSTLTLDLLKDTVVKDMDEEKQVKVMRYLIVVFVAISVTLPLSSIRRM